MLISEVGAVKPAREADFMKLMLTCNAAWEQTAGLRFVIDPLSGVAALHFPLPIAEADVETLALVIANRAERPYLWGKALQSEGTPVTLDGVEEGEGGVVFRAKPAWASPGRIGGVDPAPGAPISRA
ncbi:MAG: type III secretion system chaperone [Pseudomonadota bacterium]